MVINVFCESRLIELNNPFSDMTLDEAFNVFTENVNIALNEISDVNIDDNDNKGNFTMNGCKEPHIAISNAKYKIKDIIDLIADQIKKLWDKFIEFIQNFTSTVMKKFLSIGIDKKKSWNLITNMKEDFTVTIKGTVVTNEQYKRMLNEDFYAKWYKDFIEGGKEEIEKYFASYRRVDYEYKITKQIGINAWNIIFNSKSKFISEAIKCKKSYTKGLSTIADRNDKDAEYFIQNKNQMYGISKICKEEISVYRDYLKTCAKVLKAIISHGGNSKYDKNQHENDMEDYANSMMIETEEYDE